MKPRTPAVHGVSMLLRRGARSAAFLISGLCILRATVPERMMFVTTDVTKEGKAVAPPTADRPAYYVPAILGYAETGDVAQHFQREPSGEPIVEAVVTALAKQHYLLASREFPPTLTIAIEWGTITPVYVNRTVINSAEIRARVVGAQGRDLTSNTGYNREIMSLTGKHFLTISAFAYQRTVTKESPDILLWCAHSATEQWGHYLDEVIAPLIAVATPTLGRPTKPGVSWREPNGSVKVGDAVVTESDLK